MAAKVNDLTALERKIRYEYIKAYQEAIAEANKIAAKINSHPEWSTERKALEWQKYDRLDELCAQMANVIDNAGTVSQKFISNSSINMFMSEYNGQAKNLGFALLDNTAARNILTKQINPFTKISFENLTDKRVMTRKLKSEMLSSILQGESIPKMAERIRQVTQKSLKDCIRIARTETTRVMNSATQNICEQGEKMGLNMWKRWYATPDTRCRQEHLDADGQEVPDNQPFIVGGEELMFPADESHGASAWNIINCRCRSVAFVKRKQK